jgi:glutathione S-transferase
MTPYLAGGEITAADLAVYPIYAGRKALPDNAGLKHLQAWGERIGSRPGVQKGMKLENRPRTRSEFSAREPE